MMSPVGDFVGSCDFSPAEAVLCMGIPMCCSAKVKPARALRPIAVILEVGCGRGSFGVVYTLAVHQVTDVSKTADGDVGRYKISSMFAN
jgi:hypothetical protein